MVNEDTACYVILMKQPAMYLHAVQGGVDGVPLQQSPNDVQSESQ